MLDFPKRPKGLQRRLARKRSNTQPSTDVRGRHESQSASPRSPEKGLRSERRLEKRMSPRDSAATQRRQTSSGAGSSARQETTAAQRSRPNAGTGNANNLGKKGSASGGAGKRFDPLNRPSAKNGQAQTTGAASQRAASSRGLDRALERSEPASRANRGRSGRHSSDRRDLGKAATTRFQQVVRPDPNAKRSHSSPLVYLVRLLIVGVGVGALAGTVISVWNPGLRNPAVNQVVDPTKTTQQSNANSAAVSSELSATIGSIRVGHELTDLVVKVTPLVRPLTDLVPGVFVMDLDSGDFFSFNGSATFSAASMIKLPILVAFFQDIDAGKIKLDEVMQIQQADIAEGSGDMQSAGAGAQYSALETATNMIINSDNTATNMIIRRIGGIQVLNQRFQQWGLQQTMLRKPLPDLEGTNTTSPKELVNLMTLLHQGKLISMKSRDRAFDIMRRTVTATLLPSVMTPGSTIAHKTGDIGSMVGDVGIIDMPSGRRYAVAEMVKRPHNDARAQDLIRQIAAVVYQHFGGQPVIMPSLAPSPAPTAPAMTPTPMPTSADGAPLTPIAPTAPQPAMPTPMQPGLSSPAPAMPTAPTAPVEPTTSAPAEATSPTPVEPTPAEPESPGAAAPTPGATDEHADAGITFTPVLSGSTDSGSPNWGSSR